MHGLKPGCGNLCSGGLEGLGTDEIASSSRAMGLTGSDALPDWLPLLT